MPRDSFVDALKRVPRHVRMRFRKGLAYRTVFGTPSGQEVLADLMAFCLMNADTHVPGSADESAYNAGKRRVGLRIAAYLKIDEREIMRLAEQSPFTAADEGIES